MAEKIKLPGNFDKHHIWWTRSAYRRGISHTLRTAGGCIVPTPRLNHEHLHRVLDPPPKPTNHQMEGIINSLEEAPDALRNGFTWGIAVASDFLSAEAERDTSPQRAQLARDISDHLEIQMGIVTMKIAR